MIELLEQALELCPTNQTAVLNLGLAKWRQGLIRDDEFQKTMQSDMHAADAKAAALVFNLFKL